MSRDGIRSILVVEDDESTRMLVRDELSLTGCQIWLAADAAQAIAILQGGIDIDLVLTDVMMPGAMNGLGLAAWIELRHPGLPVALTSAKSREAIKRLGLRDDQAFFRKPILFADLRRHVELALASSDRTTRQPAAGSGILGGRAADRHMAGNES
jgi:CheY-like chemotaxis protein